MKTRIVLLLFALFSCDKSAPSNVTTGASRSPGVTTDGTSAGQRAAPSVSSPATAAPVVEEQQADARTRTSAPPAREPTAAGRSGVLQLERLAREAKLTGAQEKLASKLALEKRLELAKRSSPADQPVVPKRYKDLFRRGAPVIPAPERPPTKPASASSLKLAPYALDTPARGPMTAPAVLVKYTDFQ